MGFFSKIKKLWGGDTPADTTDVVREQSVAAEPAQTVETAAPVAATDATEEPMLMEDAAPQETPNVTIEPAELEADATPAPAAAPEVITVTEIADEPVTAEEPVTPEPEPAPLSVAPEQIPEVIETEEALPVTIPEAVIPSSAEAAVPPVEETAIAETAPEEPAEQEEDCIPATATEPEAISLTDEDTAEEIPVDSPAEPAFAPVEEVHPETPQQTPDQPKRKSGGWRSFFGLGPKDEQSAPATPAPADIPLEPKEEILFQEKPTAAPSALEPWQQALTQSLREAEPRLSVWMVHILDGVQQRGDTLWNRLRFLFTQLEVPEQESEDFIRRFDKWLDDMEYDHVDEFRSELQYRMALALDLEDEEDERNRLFLKLSAGLGKTREQLTMRIDQLLSMAGGYDEEFWEELEEILLMADVGVNATQELIKRLRPKVRKSGSRDAADFKALLKEELAGVFQDAAAPTPPPQGPEVVLMVGVNGAGKTTTIAKLAHRAQMQGRKVLVAAGDTFRAAAIEQLQVWAKRVGAGFYAKTHGSDPAAVAFEAMDYALKEGYDMVFVDTAGRLQTKHNLMEELKKINRVLGKKVPNAPHRTILVLDATTGQNALSQVKLFSESAPINEVILTKLDGTAKGGVIVAIALEFGIPISFVGLGEKMEDLRPFSGQEFASALFD